MTGQAEEMSYKVTWMLAQKSSQPINNFEPTIQELEWRFTFKITLVTLSAQQEE